MKPDVTTEFKDRSGRVIHIGDIVEHRLDKFGKSKGAGPSRYIVTKTAQTRLPRIRKRQRPS